MYCDEFESVYEAFYNLSAKPFRLSPDPQFFYPSAGHKRALSYLLYGLNQAEGFVVITGAPGTGKTTLAHKLLSQIDAQSVVVVNLASTQIEAEDLLRLVAASFKLRSEHVSKASLLKDIESFLLGCARERKRCLLVVDEAQNLPARSIEELRMLSNFQVGNKALMQVFLLGQEQFRVMLDSSHFEQLRQRVIADYHLHPLDAEETRRYIEARLQHVGWQNDPAFDAGAYAMIFQYTGGLPRRINMFCDRLLLFGYLEGLHTLTYENVCGVIAELHNEILPRNSNVVFTPPERPAERIATVESRTTGPVAVRTAPTIATVQAVPATPKLAETQQSPLPPAPVSPPSLPPWEPVMTETTSALSTRELMDENSGPAMADFLLTPSLRPSPARWFSAGRGKSNAVEAADQQGWNTADQRPRAWSNMTASLASTEARWLLIITGAGVVLLIFAFLLYPLIQEALQQLESPHVENGGPFMGDTTEPPAGLIQQISDPSENILTEKRILASSSSADPENVTVDTLDELPRDSNNPVAMPESENNLPVPIIAGNTAATPAVDPPTKTSVPEQKNPAKTKPDASVGQRSTSSTLTQPPPVAKSAAVLPEATNTPATTTPTLAPLAQIDAGTSSNVISPRELALLVLKFTRYYQEGNLPQFLGLFDPQVRTEDSTSIDAIHNDYSDLFKQTALREILFGDIQWENSGRLAQGMGLFEVRISAAPGEPLRSLKGDITFHLEKKGSNIVIVGFYHTLR